MKTHDVSAVDFIKYCHAHGFSKKDSRKFLNLLIEFATISMENEEVFTIQKFFTMRMKEYMYTKDKSIKTPQVKFTTDFKNNTKKC